MSLLHSLRSAAEQDYARPPAADARRPGPLRRVILLLVIVAVVGVLTVAVRQQGADEPSQQATRDALAVRVQTGTDQVDALQQDIVDARARIQAAEDAAPESTGVAARNLALARMAGLTAVTGPGVRLVIDDADDVAETGAPPDGGRVLDQDLQIVVNGLWRAGAEAIAVGGRRLTATSAIRTAGLAILVDFRPLLPPYTVEAVGDPGRLVEQFGQSAAAADLAALQATFGIRWELEVSPDLTLPAATGSTR